MFNVNLCQGYLIFFFFLYLSFFLKKNYFCDILLERNQKSLEFESKVWEQFGSNHNITKYLCSLPLAPLVDSRTSQTCDDETGFAWVSWSSAHEHMSSRYLWWRRVHRLHGLNNQVSPPTPHRMIQACQNTFLFIGCEVIHTNPRNQQRKDGHYSSVFIDIFLLFPLIYFVCNIFL